MRIIELLKHKETKRFLRFMVVGVSGTLVDFAILTLLKTFTGLPTLAANTISYSCGVVNNFTLNRLWTFSEAKDKRVLLQFGQFAAVNVVGVILNNLIVVLLEAPFGTLLHNPDTGYLPAKVIATGIVLLWNFIANRLWTFKSVS